MLLLDSQLRTECSEMSDFPGDLPEFAKDMFSIIHPDGVKPIGIGLAANQVGYNYRLAVISVPGYPDFVICNPVVIWDKGYKEEEEGCLSLPGIKVVVGRATKIRLNYQTMEGFHKSMVATDLLARCILHEIDHLNGILITDYVDGGLGCSGITSDGEPCALQAHSEDIKHSETGPFRNKRPASYPYHQQ